MANFKGIMRKLQQAILRTGLVIKINSYQFYSEEQKRLISKYRIITPVFRQNKNGEWKDIDYEVLSTCSLVEVVECLNDIYKAVIK